MPAPNIVRPVIVVTDRRVRTCQPLSMKSMKCKLIALMLALTLASWAQNSTQTEPSTRTSPEKAACSCCAKGAPAEAKSANGCCAHHDMAGQDAKEPGCCAGKDKSSCCGAKSCARKKGETQAACNGEKCGKECKQCSKACRNSCKNVDKTATNYKIDPIFQTLASAGR